jgi:SAM-dependent methyltransferase
MSTSVAEFDAHAAGYDAGMEHPLKRLLGRSAEEYVACKVRWLLRELRRRPSPGAAPRSEPLRLLDFGCGAGTFLRQLRRSGMAAELTGCDVSDAMLHEARARWDCGPEPRWDVVGDGVLPYAEREFDVVILCCVLHHVPAERRRAIVCEAARVLAPDGRLFVFEHNPWNPLTRWVVRTTAIDRHVSLLTPREVGDDLRAAGLSPVRPSYLLFFPPRWPWCRWFDDRLGWCPVGGQYVVTGGRP